MAKEDLIPFTERSEDEVKEMNRKGGINSGITRRKKKTMREQAELLLSLSVKNPKLKMKMKELGLDEDEQTNQMAMIISIMNKAISKGDVNAFNSLQATIGENPNNKSITINDNNGVIDKLANALGGLCEFEDDEEETTD